MFSLVSFFSFCICFSHSCLFDKKYLCSESLKSLSLFNAFETPYIYHMTITGDRATKPTPNTKVYKQAPKARTELHQIRLSPIQLTSSGSNIKYLIIIAIQNDII